MQFSNERASMMKMIKQASNTLLNKDKPKVIDQQKMATQFVLYFYFFLSLSTLRHAVMGKRERERKSDSCLEVLEFSGKELCLVYVGWIESIESENEQSQMKTSDDEWTSKSQISFVISYDFFLFVLFVLCVCVCGCDVFLMVCFIGPVFVTVLVDVSEREIQSDDSKFLWVCLGDVKLK